MEPLVEKYPSVKEALQFIRENKLACIAGVLTAGETAVTMGLPLPFTDAFPQWARGLLIMGLVASAFVARLIAQRKG